MADRLWLRTFLRLRRRRGEAIISGLYEGTSPVEPSKTPEQGYTLTEDLADRAITWVRQQKVLMPDKPFMMYFAPGATHAPHHVPKEWSDKYKASSTAAGTSYTHTNKIVMGFILSWRIQP